MPAVPFEKQGRCSGNLCCTNISPRAGSLPCARKSWLRCIWWLTQPLFLPCHYLTCLRNSLSMLALLTREFPGLQWLNILDLHDSRFTSFGTGQGSFSSKLIHHCFFISFWSPFPVGSDPCDLYPGPGCSFPQVLLSRDLLCSVCCVQLLPSPGVTDTHFGPEKAEAEPVRSGVTI